MLKKLKLKVKLLFKILLFTSVVCALFFHVKNLTIKNIIINPLAFFILFAPRLHYIIFSSNISQNFSDFYTYTDFPYLIAGCFFVYLLDILLSTKLIIPYKYLNCYIFICQKLSLCLNMKVS